MCCWIALLSYKSHIFFHRVPGMFARKSSVLLFQSTILELSLEPGPIPGRIQQIRYLPFNGADLGDVFSDEGDILSPKNESVLARAVMAFWFLP